MPPQPPQIWVKCLPSLCVMAFGGGAFGGGWVLRAEPSGMGSVPLSETHPREPAPPFCCVRTQQGGDQEVQFARALTSSFQPLQP